MKKKEDSKTEQQTSSSTTEKYTMSDDFSKDLIKQINKEAGSVVAFNLSEGTAPTVVKSWISTGSRQLDSIIKNDGYGGLPSGRIVEISGPFGCGKSTLSALIAANTQKNDGVVIYIDSESATSPQNLAAMGVDVTKKFVFVQTGCTEEAFSIAESAILKTKSMIKEVPVTVIVDSIAALAPKAELEGDYDQNTIGLQARVIGKALRKITNIIADKNVLLVLINQQRTKIGVTYGDPTTTTGGMSIPYFTSTRIQLSAGSQLKDPKDDNRVYGVEIQAKTIKNKVGHPFRKCHFQIHFGRGIIEHENVFDVFREYCDKNGEIEMSDSSKEQFLIEGSGAWKTFTVFDKNKKIIHEVKFNKSQFGDKVLYEPKYSKYMNKMWEEAFTIAAPTPVGHTTYEGLNKDNLVEVEQAQIDQASMEM
jgi:recombination protein RecA